MEEEIDQSISVILKSPYKHIGLLLTLTAI